MHARPAITVSVVTEAGPRHDLRSYDGRTLGQHEVAVTGNLQVRLQLVIGQVEKLSPSTWSRFTCLGRYNFFRKSIGPRSPKPLVSRWPNPKKERNSDRTPCLAPRLPCLATLQNLARKTDEAGSKPSPGKKSPKKGQILQIRFKGRVKLQDIPVRPSGIPSKIFKNFISRHCLCPLSRENETLGIGWHGGCNDLELSERDAGCERPAPTGPWRGAYFPPQLHITTSHLDGPKGRVRSVLSVCSFNTTSTGLRPGYLQSPALGSAAVRGLNCPGSPPPTRRQTSVG
ncbi:MAG: hypothetical protein Ct9H300mP1_29360 [Planctomycetaceae bacterium]|nr:MAG: hypothetical protein Ct9H300mP1_29360 [Planctomycetaceae bacterium]